MGIMKELGTHFRGSPTGSQAGYGGRGGFVRIKSLFFDREAVIRQMDAASHRVLNHFGGLCMKIARNSIRSRHAVSSPGQPPSSHVGATNRLIRKAHKAAGTAPPKLSRGIKEIYYSWDAKPRSVVIGPIKFNSSQLAATHGPAGDFLNVLELLEYGGSAVRKGRFCTYRARPFMGPAFDKASEKLPAMWANSVTR